MLLLRWDCWAPNVILKSALVLAIEPVGAAQQTANYVIRLQNASPVWSISWTSPVWSRRSMNHSMLKQHWWVGEVLVTKSRISAQSGFAHCMHKLNPAFWISFIIFIVILFILKLKVGSPSFVFRFHPGLCCQFLWPIFTLHACWHDRRSPAMWVSPWHCAHRHQVDIATSASVSRPRHCKTSVRSVLKP